MKIQTLVAIALAMMLSACAHSPGVGSWGDATTTYVNLSHGHSELNPVFSWTSDPLTIALASMGVKHAVKYALDPVMGKCRSHQTIEGAGVIATGWNMGTFVANSYPPAILLGAVAGVIYYSATDCEE